MMVVFAGAEWWFYFNPAARNPVIISLLALMLLIYAGYQVWRAWFQLRQIEQGLEGEKTVGQFLENLRGKGYQVFHDLQGADFNVDHVIIGPGGVFTIETKTLSKPLRGETRLQFNGKTVSYNGKPLERDPITQAKAQAGWVKKVLSDYSGAEFGIKPVVLFPGWFIENPPGKQEIWVLEPKALPKWLANEPNVLSTEQINLASSSLARFIRD